MLRRTDSAPSRKEILALAELLEEALARIDADEKQAVRHYTELERRLLDIENSRFLRTLQWPGRFLGDWKGRLGQVLLHSPLHPLYLKLVNPHRAEDRYRLWVESERTPAARPLTREPLLCVILPVYNPRRDWLEAAVESVRGQSYGCWQLCVCDDASAESWVAEYFEALSATEPRIRFVQANEHLGISGALNRAAELASGEYAGFVDQDDLLAPHALASVAEAVADSEPDLVYSDEDYLDDQGRRVQPIFKPAFSPDLLRCGMYLGHLLVVRTARLRELGGFRAGYDGSQDYDLALRLTGGGLPSAAMVRHIPRVLYHWRRHADSTAQHAAAKPYTQSAGLKAVSEAVARRDAQAVVTLGTFPNTYRVRWFIPEDLKTSLIICSRDAKLLSRCLEAIARQTAHANREVLVVQHLTGDIAAMDRLLNASGCIRVPYAGPFHFAAMNNLGAAHASGEALVFMNDDVEPLDPDWLGALLAHVNRREVGAVGARLVYPSGAVQHAGIVIGIMEGAGHLHRNTFGSPYWNWLPFTRNVCAVTGACLAIRKEVFEELGGFDESFPVNYNDVDLCLRARQAGYEVIVEPAALLRHYECQSRQAGVRLEERYLFEQRWGVWLERGDPFYSPHLRRTLEDAGLELHDPAEPATWR
ncbi:MAG TPA: glycosyltransferase [Bryobacteraceae bacterium]|nr:glycosyltransferase [Bryobacteraceae bacterium]